MTGKLLLLPNLLGEELPADPFLPSSVAAAVASLHGLIAESEKAARRYLKRFLPHEIFSQLPLKTLNEHSSANDLSDLLLPIQRGETWGLISDAGLPCIADPGADLVWRAHEQKIPVETFVGPSSLLIALQLSGLNGQRFCFHGYLPRELPELERTLAELEKRSHSATQIWIEAPYRSAKMLETLLKVLPPSARLCVAANLTTKDQKILSQPVAQWRKTSFPLEKEPAVFLLDSHSAIPNKRV